MSFAYQFAGEELWAVLGGLLSGFPSTALGIVSYILTALALYTVAKRRAIRNAWLAWIPLVRVWLLGSISDQYRYVVKGQIKSRRKVLLVLQITICLLGVALAAAGGVMVFRVVSSAAYSVSRAKMLAKLLSSIGMLVALALPIVGATIAYKVFYFITLYDVYTSMDPENNVLFLVLSILFPVAEPFFLFFNRNGDKGMPPRREVPVQEPWEQDDKDY